MDIRGHGRKQQKTIVRMKDDEEERALSEKVLGANFNYVSNFIPLGEPHPFRIFRFAISAFTSPAKPRPFGLIGPCLRSRNQLLLFFGCSIGRTLMPNARIPQNTP